MSISQVLLTSDNEGNLQSFQQVVQNSMASVVPPNLETLEVTLPAADISPCLDELLAHKLYCPKMHRIAFCEFHNRDATSDSILFGEEDYVEDSDIEDRLAAAGISCYIP